jgi:hypothetical protein
LEGAIDDVGDRLAIMEGLAEALERESGALHARIKRLQDAGKTVIAQRERWKARALAAEGRLQTECRHPG